MKHKLILFTIPALLFACQNHLQKPSELKSNKTFSESETEEIIDLLHSFDQEICKIENLENENVSACYRSFFERIKREIEDGDYEIGISEAGQKAMVGALSQELREEFWRAGRSIINRRIPNDDSGRTFPDTVQSIYFADGKYLKFLEEEVSGKNPQVKQYVDNLRRTMGISPSVFADVVFNYKAYDVKDERIRLLIAIHYLTLNDFNLKYKASNDRLKQEGI